MRAADTMTSTVRIYGTAANNPFTHQKAPTVPESPVPVHTDEDVHEYRVVA